MKIIKQSNSPKVIDAKRELERISALVNMEKATLEKLGRDCDSKSKSLLEIIASIGHAQEALKTSMAMQNDLDLERADMLKGLSEIKEDLKEVKRQKELIDSVISSDKAEINSEREKIVSFKNKTLLDIEAVSRIEEMRLQDVKRKKAELEKEMEAIEAKIVSQNKALEEGSKDIEMKLTNLAELHKDYLNGESKLSDMKDQIKVNELALEEQKEKLESVNNSIRKAKLEFDTVNKSLEGVRKDAQDAKESILKSVAKEEYIEKASKKIRELYARAGIVVSI